MVSVGMNGKMESSEAAKVLNCSYSHLINMVKAKKIKAQKIENRWMLEADDVYRAKSTGLIKGKKSNGVTHLSPLTEENKVRIMLDIDPKKYELLRLALKNKTVPQFVSEQVDKLYAKIEEQLAAIEV